jgi:Domain of Unknown Function (DUF1080)
MKRAQGGLAALVAVFAIAAIIGTEVGQAGGQKSEEGYTSLFNGKDLTGWRYPGAKGETLDGKTETPDKRIQVVGGIIVVNEKDDKGKGGIRDLYTVQQFDKNFHLKVEFRAAPRADSGLYIRGPQLQVRDYPTVGPYKPKGFKPGDWNELDVTVKAGVVATSVNGKAVTDKDVLEVTVKDGKPVAKLNGTTIDVNNIQITVGPAALCKCNGEVIEQAMKVPAKGGIGLQAESGKFEFRNVRVKELP